jgi:hypothetical protein
MMEGKIPKPETLTDAEAESFIRFLTTKEKKKLLIEALVNTNYGANLFEQWLRFQRKP